jgi:hypothetical protein
MKSALLLSLCFLSIVISGCSSPKVIPPPEEPLSNAPAMPQMSEAEMMEVWKKASTPSENHKLLSQYLGRWKTETKFWKDPTLPPEITRGSSTFTPILGGRFIQQEHKGTFMGAPFSGSGVIGFDNGQGKFVSSWMDSSGTGLMTSSGVLDSSGRSIAMTGSFFCPLMKDWVKTREVMSLVDNKSFMLEMFALDDTGKETRMLEILYFR